MQRQSEKEPGKSKAAKGTRKASEGAAGLGGSEEEEECSSAESDGYGDGGLSWEAVLASIKVIHPSLASDLLECPLELAHIDQRRRYSYCLQCVCASE